MESFLAGVLVGAALLDLWRRALRREEPGSPVS